MSAIINLALEDFDLERNVYDAINDRTVLQKLLDTIIIAKNMVVDMQIKISYDILMNCIRKKRQRVVIDESANVVYDYI